MKNLYLTFLFFGLLTPLFSQINVSQNFDSSSNYTNGWYDDGSFIISSTGACSGNSVRDNLWYDTPSSTGSVQGKLYSPVVIGISSGTPMQVSFDYKIVNYRANGAPNTATPPGWGNLKVEFTTDQGQTWNPVITIDDTNHVTSVSCTTINQTIPANELPHGADFQLRFTSNWLSGDFFVYLDNISAVQNYNSLPACDVNLISPANGSVNASNNGILVWDNATGSHSNELSVGTTPGASDVLAPTFIPNGVNTYNLGTLAQSTTYYVRINPINEIGTQTCNEFQFTTDGPPLNDPCSGAFVVNSFPYNITQDASQATNNNGFISSCAPGMNDGVWYTFVGDGNQITIDVEESGNWSGALGLYTGNCTSLNCIDFSNVGSTEQIVFSSVAGTTYYINIGGNSGTNDLPEGVFDLSITSEPSCPAPSNLSLSAITDNASQINWVENGSATSWEIQYGPAGFTLGSGSILIDNDATPNEVITGLTASTSYEVYVRALCGTNDESVWIGPVSFQTSDSSCSAPSNIIITNVTKNSAAIDWQENGSATAWQVVYGVQGFDPTQEGISIFDNDGTKGLSIQGLQPNTTYDVYVFAVCSNDLSDLFGPTSFTTQVLSAKEETLGNLEIYPNPVKDIVFMKSSYTIDKVKLYNLRGQLIWERPIQALKAKVNLGHLNAGVYVFQIEINGTTQIKKLVIQ